PPTSSLFPYTTLFRSTAIPVWRIGQRCGATRAPERVTVRMGGVASATPPSLCDPVGKTGMRFSHGFGFFGDCAGQKTTSLIPHLDRKSTRLNSSHSQI